MRHRISDPDPDARTGTCSVCGPVKVYRNASRRGTSWRCSSRLLRYTNDRYEDVKDRQRELRFERTYGITPKQYDQMLADQGGVCARCKQPPKTMRLAVDHCHSTGRVRGLLCGPCNTYIGRLEANMNMLDEDLAYISADVIAKRL